MAKRRNYSGAAMVPSYEPPPQPAPYPAFPTRQNGTDGKMDFVGMIAKGESARGFVAQTANGTARGPGNTGWNKQYDFGPDMQVQPCGPWKSGPSDRTGE